HGEGQAQACITGQRQRLRRVTFVPGRRPAIWWSVRVARAAQPNTSLTYRMGDDRPKGHCLVRLSLDGGVPGGLGWAGLPAHPLSMTSTASTARARRMGIHLQFTARDGRGRDPGMKYPARSWMMIEPSGTPERDRHGRRGQLHDSVSGFLCDPQQIRAVRSALPHRCVTGVACTWRWKPRPRTAPRTRCGYRGLVVETVCGTWRPWWVAWGVRPAGR